MQKKPDILLNSFLMAVVVIIGLLYVISRACQVVAPPAHAAVHVLAKMHLIKLRNEGNNT